jgi:hypothetical protein
VAAKGLVRAQELTRRKEEWAEAARATPHGQSIELGTRQSTNASQGSA